MTFLNEEDKPSLEDAIAHSGVKGMKWGVRKKPTAHDIRTARRSVDQQRDNIKVQKKQVKQLAKGSKERTAGEKKLSDMKTSFLKNPDRVTAMRLTKGEAAVTILFSSPLGSAASIGAIAARRRSIAKKQARGAYDK